MKDIKWSLILAGATALAIGSFYDIKKESPYKPIPESYTHEPVISAILTTGEEVTYPSNEPVISAILTTGEEVTYEPETLEDILN